MFRQRFCFTSIWVVHVARAAGRCACVPWLRGWSSCPDFWTGFVRLRIGEMMVKYDA